jgi:putative mRNA 3-end processing factor
VSPRVRLRDGVVIELAEGTRVVLDGAADGDVTVVSHAHGDHLVDGADRIVASELTAALAGIRQEETDPRATEHPAIELFPAGHVAGSRAARITDPETGRTYLYTGDVSTRNRFYLDGFEPVGADVLITEATYGEPGYAFPPTESVVDEIHDWLAGTMDTVVLVFGYALGRAQKLQRLLADSARSRVFVTDAIAALNTPIETALGVEFPARRYDAETDLEPGDALVLPMGTTRINWIETLIENHDALTAGFSGWATDDSFIYRRGFDRGFPMSDHCDFEELVGLVEAVDPETVYTQHGSADALADHLVTEHDHDATALKKDQSTLADY